MPVPTRRAWLVGQLVIAAAVCVPAHAQSTASGSLPIAAVVASPLSLTITHPLDFGKLLTSTSKTVVSNTAAGGRFELSGEGGSNITVTFLVPSSISPTSGAPIPVTAWNYMVSDTPSFGGTAVTFASGTGVAVPATFHADPGSTRMYFAVGATVTASSTAVMGAYTGVGTITVSYTDL
jgi:uncharacterized protein DUF4402